MIFESLVHGMTTRRILLLHAEHPRQAHEILDSVGPPPDGGSWRRRRLKMTEKKSANHSQTERRGTALEARPMLAHNILRT